MISLATIGTSTITRTLADAVTQVPGIEITTVFSRDPVRGAEFGASICAATVISHLDDLCSASGIDAVYVASPNGIHGEQARQLLTAGKHVLVEKPAVPTVAEFGELIQVAAANGVVVLEAMRNAYDPGLRGVGDLMTSIGRLRRASLAYCQRSARYDRVLAGKRVNIFDPTLAGGALYDLGVYPIAAMLELFGEPDRVRGDLIPVGGGADGAGAALAAYDGFVVDLAWSKITASDRWNEIQGELGTITFDHVAQVLTARIAMLDGSISEHTFDGPSNNMVHEVRRFVELIASAEAGDTVEADDDHRRTLATLRVVEAIRSS